MKWTMKTLNTNKSNQERARLSSSQRSKTVLLQGRIQPLEPARGHATPRQ